MDRTFNPNFDEDLYRELEDMRYAGKEAILKFNAKHNQLFKFGIEPNEVALVYFVSAEADGEDIAKALEGFNGEHFNIETGENKECSYDNWLRDHEICYTDWSDLLILKCSKEDAKAMIKKLLAPEFFDLDEEELFSLISVHSADAFNYIMATSIEYIEENIDNMLNL